ncbi:MAG: FAD-binding protein [Planctomycetota bacterium]
MGAWDEFREILAENQPLGKLTSLGVGGPARWMASPRNPDELGQLIRRAREESIPFRIFGAGSNILVGEEGFPGLVLRLNAPHFSEIQVRGMQITAGAGVLLGELIGNACKASASGLEAMVGIPGTVGGALCGNSGGRTGDIGQHVHSVEVISDAGVPNSLMRADIRFGYRQSSLYDSVILNATFDLVEDDPEVIVRRIKKIWIAKSDPAAGSPNRSATSFAIPAA